MRCNINKYLAEELSRCSDPYSQVYLKLEDGVLRINKTYFLLMTNYMRDILKDIEVTWILIPQVTKKSFENLIKLISTGEVNFECEEEYSRFLEDIETLDFDTSKLDKLTKSTLSDHQPSTDHNLKERSTQMNPKIIDRFEVKEKNVCRYCLTLLSSKQACKRHERTCDKNPLDYENYKCSECDQSFKTQAGLKSHSMANHQSFKMYKCGSCDKEFKHEHEQSLKRHCQSNEHDYPKAKELQLSQDSENKTWCKVCFKYINTIMFELHEKYHYTSKFECESCDFICNRKDSLDRHEKLVHNIHRLDIPTLNEAVNSSMKYTCNKCKEQFEGEDKIKDHIKLKNCKKLRCNFCQKDFTLLSNMQRHIKKFHN